LDEALGQQVVIGVSAVAARRLRAAALSSLLLGLAAGYGNAKAQSLPSTGTRAVPTYEAVGLYWANPGGTAGCQVKYRKAGASAWSPGLDLWYDARDTECRGSLVHLEANTEYQVELNLPGQAPVRGLTFRTWANQRPVAKTITVDSGSGTLNVTEGGSAAGYVVYQGASGATLDGQNSAQYNVTINASYVIVRGLKLKGAKADAIRISPNVKDVVIEDNDISGWGRQRSGNWGVDMDSAVRAVCTQPTLERVTVQRNRIHNPRYSANSWSDGHPAGPQAIAFAHCGGNHVFRHNEIYSTNGNYFNDIIGGEDNFTKNGFPNSDSDIYGNRLSHAWDDAIEAEGANENVRIWGNYIDRTAIGIATTATTIGPAYVFRNVWNRSQFYERAALDSDSRQPFFKSGGDNTLGHGRRYFFHNTMLQATQAGTTYGLGGGFGMGGTGAAQLITNTFSKNNIYHLWKPGKSAFYQTGSGNEIAADMYNGTPGDATIVNGINATPVYAPGHGWVSEAGGNYQLAASSPGYDRGARIPNFNDGFGGAAPDVGAHEAGTASMTFGVAASPGASVSGAASIPDPSPAGFALSISKSGSGAGTVTSSAGIDCGSTCSATLASGTAATLAAAPAAGSSFAGWGGACAGTGLCTVTVSSAVSVSASFNAVVASGAGVTTSASSLSFGGAAPATQTVTYTNNTGAKITFMQALMSSTRYGQTNTCGEVAPGSSCTAAITYYPNNGGSDSGTFTLTSTAPDSPHVVSLDAGASIAGASLVTHFYRSILHREPDAAGRAFWDSEAARVAALGADVNEVWYAMAMSFFSSAEYRGFNRDSSGFVTDLYAAFFDRAPDAGGFAFYGGQLANGMPREVVLAEFLFSREFTSRTRSMSGAASTRAEVNIVLDFYRGLLMRLPDSGGLSFWVQEFRQAQCQGAGAVYGKVESISKAFVEGREYGIRARSNAQFVGDLYNALLRRGGDLAGVQFWIGELDRGARTRAQVRQAFIASKEFSDRVAQVVSMGCAA
jgi:hypothetical protein